MLFMFKILNKETLMLTRSCSVNNSRRIRSLSVTHSSYCYKDPFRPFSSSNSLSSRGLNMSSRLN